MPHSQQVPIWLFALCVILGAPIAASAQPPIGPGRMAAPLDTETGVSEDEAAEVADQFVGAEPDRIYLTNGNSVQGLVIETSAAHVEFRREMGRGQFTRLTIPKSTVERIVYAAPSARQAMQARIRWWDDKKENDAFSRASYDITKSTKYPGLWEGEGKHVRIITDIDRSTAREMTWRTNSMWAQWMTLFDASYNEGSPTTMYVLQSQVELLALLKQGGIPASQAVMVAGVYLPHTDSAFVPLRMYNSELYERYIADAERQYGAQLDPVNLAYHKRKIKTLMRTERALQTTTVYHETMHAFMQKVLFAGEDQLPTWLNEGMASYVERIREDEHGMRVEAYNPERLPIAKILASKDALPPIKQLVGRRESLTEHDTAASAGAFYAASWALVYYLNTERDGLGNDMYVRYVRDLRSGIDPVYAFEQMTGEPLERTEAAWKQAIKNWD